MGKTASRKNEKLSLRKRVANEDSKLMAEYTIFPIMILIGDWDIILDTEACWGTIVEERRKPITSQTPSSLWHQASWLDDLRQVPVWLDLIKS